MHVISDKQQTYVSKNDGRGGTKNDSSFQFVSVNYVVGIVAANNTVVAVVDLC